MSNFNLSKNNTFNLSKDKPLNKIKVLAKWSKGSHTSNYDYDLDVFALPVDNTLGHPKFANLCYPTIGGGAHNSVLDGTIVHGGDEQVEGSEFLTIELDKLPESFDEVIIGLNIYENIKTDNKSNIIEIQNFNSIENESVSIIDMDNDKVLANTDSDIIAQTIKETPNVDPKKASLFEVGSLNRKDGKWFLTPKFIVTDAGLNDWLISKNVQN